MDKREYHIIVADDEALTALALACDLRNAGFRVTVVHDGCQAFVADVSDAADVLLTDLDMPRLDGGDLIRCLRARRPAIPVVIMTGQAIPPDLLEDPVSPTLSLAKPVSDYELMHALRCVLPSLNEAARST